MMKKRRAGKTVGSSKKQRTHANNNDPGKHSEPDEKRAHSTGISKGIEKGAKLPRKRKQTGRASTSRKRPTRETTQRKETERESTQRTTSWPHTTGRARA